MVYYSILWCSRVPRLHKRPGLQYACMYVCMHVCIYIYIYMYVYIYMSVSLSLYIYIHIHIRINKLHKQRKHICPGLLQPMPTTPMNDIVLYYYSYQFLFYFICRFSVYIITHNYYCIVVLILGSCTCSSVA